jgi:hypothetical protein
VRRALPLLIAALPAAAGGLGAQEAGFPAVGYRERYEEIRALTPQPAQVAAVDNLVLRRGAGRLTMERGALYLLTPIGGRTVGAVFRGSGRFAYEPSAPAERAELRRRTGAPALDAAVTEAVLLFADSTADQLRGLTFSAGEPPGNIDNRVRSLLRSLEDEPDETLSPDLLAPLLNAETNGFFLAWVNRAGDEPLLFKYDPDVREPSQLLRPVGRIRWGAAWATLVREPGATAMDTWWQRPRLEVSHYRIAVDLRPTLTQDLSFAAAATLSLRAVTGVGPWLRFTLHRELQPDSARWGSGAPAVVHKPKDGRTLWVRAERRLEPGDTASLTVFYHGDLIDRFGEWFYIDPGADWYPDNGEGRQFATFDITFRSPSWYPIASIGERLDSTVAERVLTTRWVARIPTPFASFYLGRYEAHVVRDSGIPPIEVLISEDAHRELRAEALRAGVFIPQQRRMRETVGADMASAITLFTALFGEAPYPRYYVTEIPYNEGVSFPGLIHLAWSTFQQTAIDGFDEFFRAHEAAHQWWGNGVRPASYRDAWLSEGLATFVGLWYLQHRRGRNTEYFKFLDQYQADLRDLQRDVGPIWLGFRNATPTTPAGYQVMIYEKGAWAFHMLRMLMFDLQTRKEDRFTEMLRDFYHTYRGRAATTEDFRRHVERHAGVPMDWFFDAWVYGTDIPTYRVAWTSEPTEDGRYRVRLRVRQENVAPEFRQFVIVSADLGGQRFAHFRVGVHGGETEYLSPILPGAPKAVVFNELHSVLADVKMERW